MTGVFESEYAIYDKPVSALFIPSESGVIISISQLLFELIAGIP